MSIETDASVREPNEGAGSTVALPIASQSVQPPKSFIDAGDTSWVELEPLLLTVVGRLRPGQAVEVASGDPQTLELLPDWCVAEELELIHAQPGNGTITFFIGKP